MMEKIMLHNLHTKPLIASLSAIFITCAISISVANAEQNPFHADTLDSSLMLAGHHGGGKDKMKMMDTDGDGSVSKDEFMSHKEQRFNKKDANGDGVLSEEEMKKHCKKKGHKKPAEE